VEKYARDSDLRKPKPGMLLKAAEDMDIDLAASWMVGDSARDVEAGQRAGCRTIRVRIPPQSPESDRANPDNHESVQADATVRNLVDAARIILREGSRPQAKVRSAEPADKGGKATQDPSPEAMDDSRVRQEILRHVRQLVAGRQSEEFSFTKLLAGVIQMLALLSLVLTFWRMLQDQVAAATLWAVVTVALQVMALTFFMMQRSR
jgi:hypothetical protein